jgi:hypothetical protein
VILVPLQLTAVALTVTGPSERSQSAIPGDKWPRRQIGVGSVNEGWILKFVQRKQEQTQRNDK